MTKDMIGSNDCAKTSERPKRKRKTVHEIYTEGWRDGLASAFLQCARIADGHRAIHLNAGCTMEGMAASSVAAFIVQRARECGVWDNSRPQSLIQAECDKTPTRADAGSGDRGEG